MAEGIYFLRRATFIISVEEKRVHLILLFHVSNGTKGYLKGNMTMFIFL